MSQTIKELFGDKEETKASESLTFLAAQYLLLDKQVEEAFKQVADMKANRDRAELELINAMEAAKLKSFRLADNNTLLTSAVKYQYTLPAKSEKEQRMEALAWLRRVGAKDLVCPDIHPQTLTAFLRERQAAKKPISPLIRETALRYLSVRRNGN